MTDLAVMRFGGAGYAGYITSRSIAIVADGAADDAKGLEHTLTNNKCFDIIR